nr:DNA cytosine methyltransferase [Candidatus Sigynarchaeota archaeon]
MPRQRASTAASRLNVLDLFAGAGGLSLGFKQAGFTIAAAVEMWEPAVLTYRRNHPGVALFHEDIRDESLKQRILAIHETSPIDVVIGGPPCQGYSNAGNRDPLDPRGRLYIDFFAIIKALQPKAFVMENVKGLTSMRALPVNIPLPDQDRIKADLAAIRRYKDLKRYHAQRALSPEESEDFEKVKRIAATSSDDIKSKLVPLLPEILNIARDAGYVVNHEVLNAHNFGSPQARERVFIVGIRTDLDIEFAFPEPIGISRSVKDAIGDLEGREEGCLPNHDFTRHSPAFVKRLGTVKPGETVYKHY